MRRLLLLVAALIVYGSLYPWQFDFHQNRDAIGVLLQSDHIGWSRFDVRDCVLNVLLYFPFGLAACAVLVRRGWNSWAAVLAAVALGFCLSASMELLQVYDAGRTSSRFDVETNTFGTMAGALAALLFHPSLESLTRRPAQPHAMAAALLAACWMGHQLYPFFPSISTSSLRAGVYALTHPGGVSVTEVWAIAAEWFAAAFALDGIAGGLSAGWLALAMLVLPLRVFVATRHIAAGEFVGAAAALVLWAVLPVRWRVGTGVALIFLAILFRELTPFHFLSSAQAFSWIPFQASFVSEWQSATVILFRKAFDYGAAVWLLRAAGVRYGWAAAVVACGLLGLEGLQRYLPGHVPETTDAVLALLMALGLRLLSEHGKRRGLESA